MFGIRILLILNTCLCVISENAHPYPIPEPYIHPQEPHLYEEIKKAYEYGYAVKDDYTGADFNVGESSDGKVVSGFYSLLLPDGRRQNVKYTVDDYHGYVAEVSYEGEAVYPPPQKAHRPHYEKLVPTQSEIVYNPIPPKQPFSDAYPIKLNTPENLPVPVHTPPPAPVPVYRPESFSAPVYGQFRTVPASAHIPKRTPLTIKTTLTTAQKDNLQPLHVKPQVKETEKNKYSFKIVKSGENQGSTTNTLPTMSLPV